jgi:hypothetical protein
MIGKGWNAGIVAHREIIRSMKDAIARQEEAYFKKWG